MAFKVKEIHWEIMLNYMEKNKELATGKFTSLNGRDTYKKMWINLGNELNATGYGERSVEKWQKCWTDFKYSLKRRSAAIKFDQNGTGGGPQQSKALNDLELRFLAILGSSFAEGVGVPERGLGTPETTMKRTIEKVEVSVSEKVDNDNAQPQFSSAANEIITPKRKRMQQDPNVMFEESIDMLKNINATIERGLGNIAQAINKLTNAIEHGGTTLNNVAETVKNIEYGISQINENIYNIL